MEIQDSNFLCWDLHTMSLTLVPNNPAACWLLLRDDTVPETLEPDGFFLVSAPTGSPLIVSGKASSLDEARRFVNDLAAGKVSAAVPGRVSGHLNQIAAGGEDPYELERRAFAAQFACTEPARGLQGFLQKNKNPFTPPDEVRPILSELIAWLADEHT